MNARSALCFTVQARRARRTGAHEVRVARSAQEACPPDERSDASGKLLIRASRVMNRLTFDRPRVFVTFLILRNALRHKLRTLLTVVGIVVAIVAFGLLRTVVDAWYAGAEGELVGAAGHAQRGVARVLDAAHLRAEDPRRSTASRRCRGRTGSAASTSASAISFRSSRSIRRAISTCIPSSCCRPSERRAFVTDRAGAIAGRKLAQEYGWKVGDTIPLRGTIFPGTWKFTLRGIYDGADKSTDESPFFFHWAYLNETIKRVSARRGDQTGVFIVQLQRPGSRGGGLRGDRRDVQRTRSPRR